jgi:iron complex outermembrane receptor protein
VDDYVLGAAATDPLVIAVATGASGDATPLRVANVDAHLWGWEATGRVELGGGLAADVAASWLDGERRDVDDGLYRLAPPDLVLGLSWTRGGLVARLEQEIVARRSAGSKALTLDPGNPANRFADVPGHGLTHAELHWRPTAALDLRLGVRNLFDRAHTDPLAGFARVSDGDTVPGERLPGDGRNVYARVRWTL